MDTMISPPTPSIACILMASGQGKRFGGNKLLADFHGKPLFAQMLSTTDLPELFTTRLIVTIHPQIQDLCLSYQQTDSVITEPAKNHATAAKNDTCNFSLPFSNNSLCLRHNETAHLPTRILLHNEPNRNDAIHLAMEQLLPLHPDGCMFCPGDQPLLSPKSLRSLVHAFQKEPDFIWRLSFDGRPGSPVIFPSRFFPELMTLPEKKGGSFVIQKYPELVRTVSAQDAVELMDVDTQEDLKYLNKIYLSDILPHL